ncbi:MAG: deoxyguanosinetriphosphate triphosphohydrolase [Micavibrio aeruginosavorus]|uniref:Deoxyguanosinetriphosphate triphosphohydrolase-like protein n=1 Tax=Micavibrio aeruginosavorus TaxID=349221 RepID=A0A7T5R3Q0_9BACT|nr:MAG: deoxyguanosinetriphosphate triphosphohydrolase [Micavibrio aeruginosavorus]
MTTSRLLDQPAYNYCALPLAAYACRPDMTRGRLHREPESQFRTPFQRDRDRVIHSSAFRRLKYKTQVFVYHEGDHYRTRLTHTLEVAQVARTLARALMVNEDLAETVALAHDLGHTPFAHMGEDVLIECMKDVGGFNHNDQSLRVVTVLERKYPGWNGLNMTWETLEGIVKHNGPVADKTLPVTLAMIQQHTDLRLDTYASIEAQVAALADDIAYNNHDVEDGLRAGLFDFDDLATVPLLAQVMNRVRATHPGLSDHYFICETVREMFGAMVMDVLSETRTRLQALNPQGPDDIRAGDRPMVAFSEEMFAQVEQLRTFLRTRMYHHYKLNRMRLQVSRIVRDLYEAFTEQYTLLPEHWQTRVQEAGGPANRAGQARVVADYIAGMTDRFALREHAQLFGAYEDPR